MNASAEIMNPRTIEIERGSVVNATMARIEYLVRSPTDDVLSPATL